LAGQRSAAVAATLEQPRGAAYVVARGQALSGLAEMGAANRIRRLGSDFNMLGAKICNPRGVEGDKYIVVLFFSTQRAVGVPMGAALTSFLLATNLVDYSFSRKK
jgi:hypothetical protein